MKLLTAEEYADLPSPDGDEQDELVDGKVVVYAIPLANHGYVKSNIGHALWAYHEQIKRGQVAYSVGIITKRNPDCVRGPDVAFWLTNEFPRHSKTYLDILPELVAEIYNRGECRKLLETKVNEYLTAGVSLVWVIDPEDKVVMVCRPGRQSTEVVEGQNLEGYDVLPGFSLQLAELFA